MRPAPAPRGSGCPAGPRPTSHGSRFRSHAQAFQGGRRRAGPDSAGFERGHEPLNLADIWEAVADAFPADPALVYGERVTPFGVFEVRAARLAALFAAHGIGRDAKVALYLYNDPAYLEAVFAALKCRAIPVNVNFRYRADELHYLIENADAEVLVFHGALAERVEAVRARLPRLRLLLQVDREPADAGPAGAGVLDYEAALTAAAPAPRIERSSEDLVFLYTGGTTGLPKGVMWTQSALVAQFSASYLPIGGATLTAPSDAVGAARSLREADAAGPGLAAAPLMHGMAWFTAMSKLMTSGAVVMLRGRSFDADEFWRSVARHRVATCTIVGDAFARPMLEALERADARGEPYDLSSLQVIVSGGVMWSAPAKQGFLDRGVGLLIDGLGTSEATGAGMMVTARGQDPTTARFTLSPHTRVLRDDGRPVEPGSGEVGVLAIGGPAVARGYYRDAEKTAATFREIEGERFSIPGDYARVEQDGSITLLGRGSVCINTGGEKVFPEEVEETLKQHPAVRDCIVVGLPDARFGEKVVAVVALEAGAGVSEGELIDAARERLAGYKAPRRVVVVDAVVRSPAGKADYGWARERAREGLGA